MSRFSVAKERVLDDLEGIVEELYRTSRKHMRGSIYNVRNPYRAKSKEEQFAIWLRGARRGAWKDFVSGDHGDAIDLVAFGLTGIVSADSRMTALAWIEDRYGLKTMDPQTRARAAAEAKSRKLAAEANDKARRDKAISRARKNFFACQEQILGTPVETYLAGRGVRLSAVPHLGRSIRYRPDCEYWMAEDRPRLPAIVTAMVDATGRIGANHHTFLTPDGRAKAGAAQGVLPGKAKLMFPETAGLVMRIADGPSGLSAEEAARTGIKGPVGITEGLEDALTGAIAEPDLRMWAAGSLSGLMSIPDHDAVSAWIVFKDNDWGKPQATRLFNRAVARLKSFGKPVEVIAVPAAWGKDLNDAINSGDW
ncbi:MAG: toprim domain-containing protein [Rhizobium sp.]|nr:toprim domain-containing protein [Rhizobium sp.]